MSPLAKQLAADLEYRFGIDSAFVEHLEPMLERFAATGPGQDELDRVLTGIAAAYRLRAPVDCDVAEELAVLLAEFANELSKIDESMQVLGVFLDRVQEHLAPSAPRRVVH